MLSVGLILRANIKSVSASEIERIAEPTLNPYGPGNYGRGIDPDSDTDPDPEIRALGLLDVLSSTPPGVGPGPYLLFFRMVSMAALSRLPRSPRLPMREVTLSAATRQVSTSMP